MHGKHNTHRERSHCILSASLLADLDVPIVLREIALICAQRSRNPAARRKVVIVPSEDFVVVSVGL